MPRDNWVAVGNRVAPVPPHRSRRAAFPHRAPAEGQTRSKVGAWAAHACFDPSARRFGDMPDPALCPEHALRLTVPSADRLPSTISATDPSTGLVRGFTGTTRPSDSLPLPRRLRLLDFPSWPTAASAATGAMRSPRFRRAPFVRDLVYDPGRATVPRIAAPLMLPSTLWTASAPALKFLSWLNTDPTRLLCTLHRGRRLPRRNTRYQAGATPYLGRTCTGWTAPASPGAPKLELRTFPLGFSDVLTLATLDRGRPV
jgi:hypothetical protein